MGEILGETLRTVQSNPLEIGIEALQTFGLGGVCYFLIKYISEDRKRDESSREKAMDMVAKSIQIATDHQGTLERLCDKMDRVESFINRTNPEGQHSEAGPEIERGIK